jgi:ribosomal protein S18 acetylase RimI-like enzyme
MPMATAAGVTIRPATMHDYDDVVAIMGVANAEFESAVPAPFYDAYLADVIDIRGRLSDTELLVAERADGRIAGAITFYPCAADEGWGWPAGCTGIRAVAVHPTDRGRGHGRLLAEACIERSLQLGVEAVVLHTAPFMKAAIALYEKLGFRRAAEFDRDAFALFGIVETGFPITALAYRLALTTA